MKVKLMNSAMMPTDGTYMKRTIDRETFKSLFRMERTAGVEFESYIGYPNLAALLSSLLEEKVEVSRKETVLEDGDKILVARLPYRIFPDEKQKQIYGNSIDDYEFSVIYFSKKREFFPSTDEEPWA